MFFLHHSNADISRPRAEWTSHLLLFVGPQLIHSQNSHEGRPSSFHQQEPCSVHLLIQNTASHGSRLWELEQRIKETMFLISQSLLTFSLSSRPLDLALPAYYRVHTVKDTVPNRSWLHSVPPGNGNCIFVTATQCSRGSTELLLNRCWMHERILYRCAVRIRELSVSSSFCL